MVIARRYSHSAIVFNYFFAEGKERLVYKNGNRIFYEHDTLYSFGYHFPLAVRCKNGHVLNGDIRSNTTTGHQNLTRYVVKIYYMAKEHAEDLQKIPIPEYFEDHPTGAIKNLLDKIHNGKEKCELCERAKKHYCIIPFSALHAAGINPRDIEIIDIRPDEYIEYKDPKTGMTRYRHILGASLFKANDQYYLSSTDSLSKRYMDRNYYLVRLKDAAKTVDEAFRQLAGSLTDDEYDSYLKWENLINEHRGYLNTGDVINKQMSYVKRQGEYFLIPTNKTTKELKKNAVDYPTEVKGISDVAAATERVEQVVKKLKDEGYGNRIHELIYNGTKYYVLTENSNVKLPERVIVNGRKLLYPTKSILRNFNISPNGNPHVATEVLHCRDGIYVRGTLRHEEHLTIHMGKIWHKVKMNTAVNSWTASGRID